jgi:hypothetical protein
MSDFTDADRARLVDIGDRLIRLETAWSTYLDHDRRESHGDRLTALETWRTRVVAYCAAIASGAGSVAGAVAHPLLAVFTTLGPS